MRGRWRAGALERRDVVGRLQLRANRRRRAARRRAPAGRRSAPARRRRSSGPPARDRAHHVLGRVVRLDRRLDRQKRPRLDRAELPLGSAFLGDLDLDPALVLVLLAEVDAVDAAGVDHLRRGVAERLVLVDVAERDVVDARQIERRAGRTSDRRPSSAAARRRFARRTGGRGRRRSPAASGSSASASCAQLGRGSGRSSPGSARRWCGSCTRAGPGPCCARPTERRSPGPGPAASR